MGSPATRDLQGALSFATPEPCVVIRQGISAAA